MVAIQSRALVLALLAPGAFANIIINNWCDVPVHVVQSEQAGCDHGPGPCLDKGGKPWVIAPGKGESKLNLALTPFDTSTSIKMSKPGKDGVLQYEYTAVQGQFGGLYWDLSDIDGSGPNLVGTPFRANNVKVTPTGAGVNIGSCSIIRCKANKVCLDSYQFPDDTQTRTCPINTGDMHVDLCMPDESFNRAVEKVLSDKPHNSTTTLTNSTGTVQFDRRQFRIDDGHF